MATIEALPFIPHIMGVPFYPGNYPVQPDSHKFNGLSVTFLYLYKDDLSTDETSFLTQYMAYYVHAPCWVPCVQLEELRKRSFTLQTKKDIDHFLMSCLEIGIDPL